jgi:hypothetical protein
MVPPRFNWPRTHWLGRLAGVLRTLGPYAAIELLVPGGTLIALAVWAFRNRASLAARARRAGKRSAVSDLRETTLELDPDQEVATTAFPSTR